MKARFHKNITETAMREAGFDAKDYPFIKTYSTHADLNRGGIYPNVKEKNLEQYESFKGLKLNYQDYSNLSLSNHHVNYINRDRILILIEYSKESFIKHRRVKDGIFHYCNALHFLCDSAIPCTISEPKRNELEKQYLAEILDIHWDDEKNKKFSYGQIENMINNFIDRIEKSENNIKKIYQNKAELYKLGMISAKYVFTY